MKSHNKFLLSSVTLAVLALMNQARAADQSDAATTVTPHGNGTESAPTESASAKAVDAEIKQVVVTGVAGGGPKRKIDTGYSITTATEEQIKEANPTSTADLLKVVPGIYVESSGGQSGANVQIRGFPSQGDSPYLTISINGSPLYPQPSLSFQANDALFRIDDTVERVEVLRGGSNPIFSNGQYGATMDFIMKTGTDTPEGSIRATFGTGDLMRYDVFYGGKISDGWYGTIGGYYVTDNGVRDAGFPAIDGGQVSATLTRKLDQGQLTFYVRSTKEDDAFYTNLPLYENTSTHVLSAFPGIDPMTATFESNEVRQIAGPGGPTGDLEKGRGLHGNVLGLNFDQKSDGWTISDRANYTSASIPTNAIFSGDLPLTMSSFIAGQIAGVNATPSVIAAAGGKLATAGTATYVDNGAAVNPNQQVIENSLWIIQKELQSFSNEFQVSKEIVKNHKLTLGVYVASYSSDDKWDIGNNFLQAATTQGRPINVTLNNGAMVTSNGYLGGAAYLMNANGNAQNMAGFVHDQWQVTDQLQLDAGIRAEHSRVDYVSEVGGATNLGNNPLNLYNTGVAEFYAPGTTTTAFHDGFNLNAYTAGGLYKLAKDMSVFARANYGGAMPNFDELRGSDPATPPPVQHAAQYELGFKTATPFYSAYVTLFQNTQTNYFQGQISLNGVVSNNIGDTTAHGLEYELAVRPLKNLQIALSGDFQRAHYYNYDPILYPGINEMALVRQPETQFRLTPSYNIPLGNGSLRLYGTYTYVGERFSDQQNTQILPSYETVDAGAILSVGEKLEFRLTGTNLTNELALTEGNVHGVNSGNLVIGRPLFGRAIQVSAMYRF